MTDLIILWTSIIIMALLVCWSLRGAQRREKPPDLSAGARWRACRKAQQERDGPANYPPDW